jgi:hypothetical protein
MLQAVLSGKEVDFDKDYLEYSQKAQETSNKVKPSHNKLKDCPDQEKLVKKLIDELGIRAKTNPTEFIPRLKTIFPLLRILLGEKPLLEDCSDQELTNELTSRINNLSLDANCLIYPLVLVGTQYLK